MNTDLNFLCSIFHSFIKAASIVYASKRACISPPIRLCLIIFTRLKFSRMPGARRIDRIRDPIYRPKILICVRAHIATDPYTGTALVCLFFLSTAHHSSRGIWMNGKICSSSLRVQVEWWMGRERDIHTSASASTCQRQVIWERKVDKILVAGWKLN